MYRMSESEFMQYEFAEKRLFELRRQHAFEITQAYDNIHPTRTRIDSHLGRIFNESVNPETYAVYLIELQEEHKKHEEWWELRVEAYREASARLTDEERQCLDLYDYGSYSKRQGARKKLCKELEKIVATRPELQRRPIKIDKLEDLDEVDRQIDKMNIKELLKDYWDPDDENLKRPKRTPSDSPRNKSKNSTLVNDVKISYLPPDELAKYRSGEKGGSKWFSYDDFLKMSNLGMSNKAIALAMGIETRQLYQRIKAWRQKGLENIGQVVNT